MKIGVLTYHRSHNYGALLQAVALRHVLAGMGHDVYFVDYWPEYHRDMYRPLSRGRLKVGGIVGKMRYLINTALNYRKIKRRISCFDKFISEYVSPYCRQASEKFDVVVYGSDQIWRKQEGMGGELNPVYFGGDVVNADRHVAYAASMGKIALTDRDKENIRKWLEKFDGVAVRESDLREVIEEIGVKDVEQVLDPTLLLESDDWRNIIDIKPGERHYVLFYDLMPESFDEEAIRRFAKEKGLDLIVLKARADSLIPRKDVLEYEDPAGMVNLIANADYVFTSSYHGLVFSLLFGKDVTAAFHHNRGRAETLLKMLGIPERLLADRSAALPEGKIDFSVVKGKMDEIRASSYAFLKKHIGRCVDSEEKNINL